MNDTKNVMTDREKRIEEKKNRDKLLVRKVGIVLTLFIFPVLCNVCSIIRAYIQRTGVYDRKEMGIATQRISYAPTMEDVMLSAIFIIPVALILCIIADKHFTRNRELKEKLKLEKELTLKSKIKKLISFIDSDCISGIEDLLRTGIDVTKRLEGETPLEHAIKNNKVEAILAIVEFSKNMPINEDNEEEILEFARVNGSPEIYIMIKNIVDDINDKYQDEHQYEHQSTNPINTHSSRSM